MDGQRATHRSSMNMSTLDVQGIEQGGHVRRPDIECVLLVGTVAQAVAARVEVDHLEMLSHAGRDRAITLVTAYGTRHLKHVLARARDFVIQLDAVDFHPWH